MNISVCTPSLSIGPYFWLAHMSGETEERNDLVKSSGEGRGECCVYVL